jgi:hypothetical protein
MRARVGGYVSASALLVALALLAASPATAQETPERVAEVDCRARGSRMVCSVKLTPPATETVRVRLLRRGKTYAAASRTLGARGGKVTLNSKTPLARGRYTAEVTVGRGPKALRVLVPIRIR